MKIKAREKELIQIQLCINDYIRTSVPHSLYICGVPGSGKTYTVMRAMHGTKHSYINCSEIRAKNQIYRIILKSFACHKNKGKVSSETLTKHLQACKENHILIIDEIDLLKTKSQSILYNIYSLSGTDCKVLLITISNSFNLDLDAKILSRQGTDKLLFSPYKSDQLVDIIGASEKSLLIARRVAAVSGDCRKAIDLNRNTMKMGLEEISRHINQAEDFLPKVYISSLSTYQKIFLMLYLNNYSLNDAFERYNIFCRMKAVRELVYLEFHEIVGVLKEAGIINIRNGKIDMTFIREEVEAFLKDDGEIIKLFV